ncbi:hypothetical protein EDD85DRAFT_847780 [Armillaria nabsnona]|nr:hypothetical protein EDD85DRAFT_847780 [Armillaria nabsnona]
MTCFCELLSGFRGFKSRIFFSFCGRNLFMLELKPLVVSLWAVALVPVVGAVTVIPSTSFSSYSTLESYWNYLYPWGSDHNGSKSIMYCARTQSMSFQVLEWLETRLYIVTSQLLLAHSVS